MQTEMAREYSVERKDSLLPKPPSPALELFRLRLQLCQLCQIRPRVPSIIERRACAVDACKAILDPQNTRGNPARRVPVRSMKEALIESGFIF